MRKSSYSDGMVIKELEKIAREHDLLDEKPFIPILKQKTALVSSEDIFEDAMTLAGALRENGFNVQAAKLEEKAAMFKVAYNTGAQLFRPEQGKVYDIDAATEVWDLADAATDQSKLFGNHIHTIKEINKMMEEVVGHKPSGKLGSQEIVGLVKAAIEKSAQVPTFEAPKEKDPKVAQLDTINSEISSAVDSIASKASAIPVSMPSIDGNTGAFSPGVYFLEDDNTKKLDLYSSQYAQYLQAYSQGVKALQALSSPKFISGKLGVPSIPDALTKIVGGEFGAVVESVNAYNAETSTLATLTGTRDLSKLNNLKTQIAQNVSILLNKAAGAINTAKASVEKLQAGVSKQQTELQKTVVATLSNFKFPANFEKDGKPDAELINSFAFGLQKAIANLKGYVGKYQKLEVKEELAIIEGNVAKFLDVVKTIDYTPRNISKTAIDSLSAAITSMKLMLDQAVKNEDAAQDVIQRNIDKWQPIYNQLLENSDFNLLKKQNKEYETKKSTDLIGAIDALVKDVNESYKAYKFADKQDEIKKLAQSMVPQGAGTSGTKKTTTTPSTGGGAKAPSGTGGGTSKSLETTAASVEISYMQKRLGDLGTFIVQTYKNDPKIRDYGIIAQTFQIPGANEDGKWGPRTVKAIQKAKELFSKVKDFAVNGNELVENAFPQENVDGNKNAALKNATLIEQALFNKSPEQYSHFAEKGVGKYYDKIPTTMKSGDYKEVDGGIVLTQSSFSSLLSLQKTLISKGFEKSTTKASTPKWI